MARGRRMKVTLSATAPPMVKPPQTVSAQIRENPMVMGLQGVEEPHRVRRVKAPPSRPMVAPVRARVRI